MGWNSWNFFACNINETVIKDTDDCWSAPSRDVKGNLVADPRTFPSGIKALADYIHEGPEGFTCQVRPGSLFHEQNDAELFASWGVDYIKYDNCFNLGIKPEERYPPMRDALNATGRAIFYSLCEWGVDEPALWAGKVGNSWRTTDDINDSWVSMTTIADLNDKWASYAGPEDGMVINLTNDVHSIITIGFYAYHVEKIQHYTHKVGNGGMTHQEYRAHFSIWALMKAPLLIGCDVRNMTTETLEILSNEEVIAVNQDPLGIQGRKVSVSGENGCEQVWAGPLSGGRLAVALWNRCSSVVSITARWETLGLHTSQALRTWARGVDRIMPRKCLLTHFTWQHEVIEENAVESFEARVDAHDCRVFVLAPRSHILWPDWSCQCVVLSEEPGPCTLVQWVCFVKVGLI
ncbi:unnamed protein product [Spirodela intermedia]|uniref:Alpha-galactosidase n=1 Tax=Spirodela intermedia TaxID=51605 RepID=A0A7I8IAD3_SPIIN|nr:unnamed protein product [Spirodela intermedia]CAA6654635.1 unnamed protein product [Spirodela intermedia]